jgi:hypothetical protein
LEDFPDDLTSDKRFIELISAAHEAGMYVIAFGNKQEIQSSKKKAIKSILKQYPIVDILEEKTMINPHESVKEVLELIARHKCNINLVNDNINDLTDSLLEKFQHDNSDNEEQDFLSVPIGTSPDGRSKINFTLGQYSNSYHAFIVGMSGTGKTTLLNNIILEIARKYTSDEIELYLMDYREGVEFQVFKNHPNCKKIFLDNEDLQAATNLLERFVNTMRVRGDLFKEKEIRDIDTWNKLDNVKPIPRVILIIDEVHRLFSGSWNEKEKFAKLLEDVSLRGRGFGVHLILSTQTLQGVDINKATMGNIPLRISYKLNTDEAALKIFGDNNRNMAPLKLKKYELIYNNDSGNKEANITCRVNAPKDIKSIINEIRETRDESLCLTPEIVRSEDKEEVTEETPPQTEWKFDSVSSTNTKYNTSEEEAMLKLLEEQGITAEIKEDIN